VEAGSQAEARGLGLGIPYSSQFHSPVEARQKQEATPLELLCSAGQALARGPLDPPEDNLDRATFLQQLVPLVPFQSRSRGSKLERRACVAATA
jgi:hypothetical protein